MKNLIFIILFTMMLSNCKSIDNGNNTTKQIIGQQNSTKDLVWKQIGPSVPNEDLLDKYSDATSTYWHGEGNVSAIWIDPKDDNHILISLAFSGLLETHNAGKDWTPIMDDIPVHQINKIEKINGDLFVSSGYRFENPQRFSSDIYYGLGIIKSSDNGKNWHLPKNNFYGVDFSLSKHHKTIYAISTTSIYKSEDNGISYTKMINLFEDSYNTKNYKIELKTIVVHPKNPNIAYVTGKQSFSNKGKVFLKTIDGGKTWTNETIKLLQFITKTPKNTTETFIKDVALYYNEETEKLWLHFSAAFVYGKNKSLKKRRYKLHSYILNSSDFNNFDFYMTQVISGGNHFSPKIHEKNNVLYLLGWYLHIKKPTESKFKNVGSNKVHQDCRAVKIDSKNVIYYGNDAGIVKSNDFGLSWQNAYKNLNANLIYEMSYYSDSKNRRLDIGTQDAGYYRNILDGKTARYPIGTHEGGIYTSPHNMNRIYIKDNRVKVSNDGGIKFKTMYLNNGKPIKIMHSDGLLMEDPIEDNILYVGHNNSLFVSDNFGKKGSWKDITPKDNGRGGDMAIPKSNTNILYYANYLVKFPVKNGGFRTYKRQNHLLKSIDRGKTWVNISNQFKNLLTYAVISDVEVDNNNPNRVWFSARTLGESKNVFYSKNGGEDWVNITYNLPQVPVNRIEYNEVTKTLYLANDYGVYYLKNNKWIEYGKGLPKVIVNGLVIDNIYNEIIVSTFGRGAWRIKLK